jgi:hypothetical protein
LCAQRTHIELGGFCLWEHFFMFFLDVVLSVFGRHAADDFVIGAQLRGGYLRLDCSTRSARNGFFSSRLLRCHCGIAFKLMVDCDRLPHEYGDKDDDGDRYAEKKQ